MFAYRRCFGAALIKPGGNYFRFVETQWFFKTGTVSSTVLSACSDLVEKQRLLGAMFDDITNPTIKRETVVKKAEDVIQKSLETVQQIASLLGENAAETEIMLNSLIDAFSVHSSGDDDKDFTMEDDRDIT